MSHEVENLPDNCTSATALKSNHFRLRDDPSSRLPDAVGENYDIGQPVSNPEIKRKTDRPGKSVKPGKSGKAGRADKASKTGKASKTNKAGGVGKPKKTEKIQSRRGIDTLFRNAYRAQLDMLSLAALKANIMISLNGLLISMLIISGAHFISINVWYSIPITLFLVSSALATIFAVLAARPDISRKNFSPEDFRNDKAHLLAFEEFSDLTEKQYVEQMTFMLGNDQRVYQSMISHVHELGTTADRKYRKLYYSYTVFIAGIILSVMSLLILAGMRWAERMPPL